MRLSDIRDQGKKNGNIPPDSIQNQYNAHTDHDPFLPAGGTGSTGSDITQDDPNRQNCARGQQRQNGGVCLPGAPDIQPQQRQAHTAHTAARTVQPGDQMENAGDTPAGDTAEYSISAAPQKEDCTQP